MRGLEGKSVLITGAARGIGLATARRLAAEGAYVLGVDRTLEGAPAEERIRWLEGDVTDPDGMAAAARLAGRDQGHLDVCIANAGISRVEDFLAGTVQSWEEVIRINLIGVMITLQAGARQMLAQGNPGRLLATASIAGVHGEPRTPAYCASKGGVMSLIQALAVELGPHEITANAVAPGQIDTEMNARDASIFSAEQGRELEDFRGEFLREQVPVRRLGSAEEVAAIYAFLASDEAPFMNGETVRIDGGELAT